MTPWDTYAKTTISQQGNILGKWLDEWVQAKGGQCQLMLNLRHLWEEILNMGNADKPRILLCFVSERARGPSNQANTLHRVDREWSAVIMRGHGFTQHMAESGSNFASTVRANAVIEPFWDTVEQLRDKIRVVLNISGEFIDFVSTAPLPGAAPTPAANAALDAYEIRFRTANDIPAILLTQPGTDPG